MKEKSNGNEGDMMKGLWECLKDDCWVRKQSSMLLYKRMGGNISMTIQSHDYLNISIIRCCF